MAQDWGARSPKEDFSTRVRPYQPCESGCVGGGSVDYYSSLLGVVSRFLFITEKLEQKNQCLHF